MLPRINQEAITSIYERDRFITLVVCIEPTRNQLNPVRQLFLLRLDHRKHARQQGHR